MVPSTSYRHNVHRPDKHLSELSFPSVLTTIQLLESSQLNSTNQSEFKQGGTYFLTEQEIQRRGHCLHGFKAILTRPSGPTLSFCSATFCSLVSACGLQTCSISIAWKVVRSASFHTYYRPMNGKFRAQPSNMCFEKPSGWIWCTLGWESLFGANHLMVTRWSPQLQRLHHFSGEEEEGSVPNSRCSFYQENKFSQRLSADISSRIHGLWTWLYNPSPLEGLRQEGNVRTQASWWQENQWDTEIPLSLVLLHSVA